jgi:hypothetical protein
LITEEDGHAIVTVGGQAGPGDFMSGIEAVSELDLPGGGGQAAETPALGDLGADLPPGVLQALVRLQHQDLGLIFHQEDAALGLHGNPVYGIEQIQGALQEFLEGEIFQGELQKGRDDLLLVIAALQIVH